MPSGSCETVRRTAPTEPDPDDRTDAAAGRQRKGADRREQALRREAQAARERLEAVLASISDAFASVDREWRFAYVNDRAAELAGTTAERMLGRTVWELLPATLGRAVHDPFHEAMRTGVSVHFDAFEPRLDRWFDIRAYPSAIGLSFVARDITDRRAAERRQRFFSHLNDVLRRTDDPREAKWIAASAVGRFLDVSRAAYGDVDAPETTLTIGRGYRADGGPIDGVQRLDALGPAIVAELRAGRTVAIADLRSDPPGRRAVATEDAVRALLGVPLVKRNRLVAVLLVHHREPRSWSAEDIDLMEQVTDRIWLASERARAESALRDSERRLRLAAEAAALGEFEYDLRSNRITRSPLVDRLFGFAPGEAGDDAAAFFARIHPDDIKRVRRHIAAAARGAAGWDNEYRVRWPNGTVRWLASLGEVVRGDDGRAERVIGILMDQTGRKQAEQALRESRERLLAALQASDTGVFRWDLRADEMVWDADLDRMLGLPAHEASRPLDAFLALIHPDDRGRARERFAACAGGDGDLIAEFRIVRSDGSIRWLLGRGKSFGPANGRGGATHITGACVDITDRKRSEEHQQLLLAELNHRVKNTLSVVLSIASQTLQTAESLDGFRDRFNGRLLALAEAHGLLTRGNWEEAPLEDLVAMTFGPYRFDAGERRRIVLGGPPVALRPQAALTLGMILHELVTNAAKYGALASEAGIVEVRWRVDAGSSGKTLSLEWREDAGRPIEAPRRSGFGSSLIRRSAVYELDGSADYRFLPDGVRCVLVIPLTPEIGMSADPPHGRSGGR